MLLLGDITVEFFFFYSNTEDNICCGYVAIRMRWLVIPDPVKISEGSEKKRVSRFQISRGRHLWIRFVWKYSSDALYMKTALQLAMETIYNTNMRNSYNIQPFLSRTLPLRTLAITDAKRHPKGAVTT